MLQQLRVRATSTRELNDSHIIDVDPSAPPIVHSSPRQRTIHYGDLEKGYGSGVEAVEAARSRPIKRWIHLIPVLVILCILILWWRSRPVKVVVKDGQIVQILHTEEIPREFEDYFWTNQTLLEGAAASPTASESSGLADNIVNEASTDSTWTAQNPNESKPTGSGSLAPDIELSEYSDEPYD